MLTLCYCNAVRFLVHPPATGLGAYPASCWFYLGLGARYALSFLFFCLEGRSSTEAKQKTKDFSTLMIKSTARVVFTSDFGVVLYTLKYSTPTRKPNLRPQTRYHYEHLTLKRSQGASSQVKIHLISSLPVTWLYMFSVLLVMARQAGLAVQKSILYPLWGTDTR